MLASEPKRRTLGTRYHVAAHTRPALESVRTEVVENEINISSRFL